MTNYIEQLMKAAGVKPVMLTDCSFINIKKGYEIGTDCCPACEDERLKCEDCEHSKLTKRLYPAFTPEKQLELIKLIAKSDNFQIEVAANQHEYVIGVRYYLSNDKIWGCSKHLELALAETAVELLQLGELDKPDVRRILEDD